MTKYSPLSRGEIWVDSAGCKWYIYGTQDYYRSSTRYLAKCIDGFALGKMREYFTVEKASKDGILFLL